MQYFLSLPPGWKAGRRYPVLVAIDGTQSAWQPAAAMFARVRDELGLDFIIVVPIVTTNVGGDPRNVNKYWYADSVWDRFARDGRCTFDFDGLKAVSEDVYLRYGGERKIYMTGFSAGGHLTWATVFRHPDWLNGAAISSGNFNGRCVTAGMTAGDGDPYSDDPSREKLPVKVIDGERDPIFATGQGTNAVSIAERKGYRNVSRETIMAHGHEPYPRQVLTFFALLRARSAVHRDTTP
jgi:poly(3-hydroxybutyrate) depolymerase